MDDPLLPLRAWWGLPDQEKQGSFPPRVYATLQIAVTVHGWSAQTRRFERTRVLPAGTRVRVTTVSEKGTLGIAANLRRQWGFDAFVAEEALVEFAEDPWPE